MTEPVPLLLTDLVLGRSSIDRAADRRTDGDWLAVARHDPATRVVLLHEGRTPVHRRDDGTVALAFTAADTLAPGIEIHLLGVDDEGRAYLAARAPAHEVSEGNDAEEGTDADEGDPSAPEGAVWRDLRAVGARLDDRDAGLLVTAVALARWHDLHPHCARCGAATEVSTAGWTRRCPQDGSEHYPRTDPAVIMLVIDADDRALLGHQAVWAPGWYSTLAGFVEPGETAEMAVRREVLEESGVSIGSHPDDVRYLGSQPWPFPSSLMLGYHARAATTAITVDGTEIQEARWFTRAELAAACEAGDVRLPPSVSIARKLIERWYGGGLPHDWSRG